MNSDVLIRHLSPFSCGPFIRVLQTLLLFALVIVAGQYLYYNSLSVLDSTLVPVFAALRVYAIWHHNWIIALPVFILAMAPVALNMVHIHHFTC
jgi:hypothetical protein